ncbi:MAG: SHOCT domain-containing protein [Bacilli bacterium]
MTKKITSLVFSVLAVILSITGTVLMVYTINHATGIVYTMAAPNFIFGAIVVTLMSCFLIIDEFYKEKIKNNDSVVGMVTLGATVLILFGLIFGQRMAFNIVYTGNDTISYTNPLLTAADVLTVLSGILAFIIIILLVLNIFLKQDSKSNKNTFLGLNKIIRILLLVLLGFATTVASLVVAAILCYGGSNNSVTVSIIYLSEIFTIIPVIITVYSLRAENYPGLLIYRPASAAKPNVIEDDDVKADLLLKYKDLLDKGVITQEEFDAKKDSLLNKQE